MARRAAVFGMRVRYFNRTRLSEDVERECGAEYVSFERLLAESDVLSLNLPLNVSLYLLFLPFSSCPSPLPPSISPSFLSPCILPPYTKTNTPQPSTRHTLSTPQFALMKKGTIIINTARGAVIDEAALVAALEDGTVASAGLDVFEDEPEVHPGLVANPAVLLVPHMGTWTVETSAKMEEWAVANVRKALREGRLESVVVEQRDIGEMWVGK